MQADRCIRDLVLSISEFLAPRETLGPDRGSEPSLCGNVVLFLLRCCLEPTRLRAASVKSVRKFRLLETYEYSDKHPKPDALPSATQSDCDSRPNEISRVKIKCPTKS